VILISHVGRAARVLTGRPGRWYFLACVAAVIAAATVISTRALLAPAAPRMRYASNDLGHYARLAALGFNTFDTGPDRKVIDALPGKALVWDGGYLNSTCRFAISGTAFAATLAALADDPKVAGFYIADEPHLAQCPASPRQLAARTALIHERIPRAFTMITIENGVPAEYTGYAHVSDYVGVDTYPCDVAHPRCDLRLISHNVAAAKAAGISTARMVAMIQAFGAEHAAQQVHNWILPTPGQERAILAEWDAVAPDRFGDYVYTWGHVYDSNPTLMDSPSLQQVIASYFAGAGGQR
jgi:hypothetical protein